MDAVNVPQNVIAQHEEHQIVVVGPPDGYSEEDIFSVECILTPVQGGALDGAAMFSNYWKPTEEEIEAIKDGALIQLSFVTDQIPPHLVCLVPPDSIKDDSNND